ncbi:metal ABC transporter solute-binding protein, Zn/Mn family [Cellulomonas hominis]
MSSSAKAAALIAASATLLALTACSSSDPDRATTGSSTGSGASSLQVVASTNVYGDIAAQIGGDLVEVTSIISDPSADPHSYEASPQTQLALSEADLVIENGGGYDDFVDTMLSALDSAPELINAVDVSGKVAADGEELNEHVWYDFPTVSTLADTIADALAGLDAGNASTYEANAAAFKEQVATLESATTELDSEFAGTGVAITEPVPGYLLDAAGLVNKTPEEFAEAIEEETDVPPTALQETLDLVSSHAVKALVYNEQTTGPETEQALQAAQDAGVAVVPVTETLPAGEGWVSWMTSNVDALRTALES